MSDYSKFIYEGGRAEITEKKSRFLAEAAAVHTEEEAAAFVEAARKRYWDARHHCSAFVLGARNEVSRCSDDGEPSGTAGRPILDVLTASGVRDACIVVTRYFGGVLLGTGGLVRAYGRAAREGLEASVVLERIPGRMMSVTCDYSLVGKVQYLLGSLGYRPLDTGYSDRVELTCLVPDGEADRFAAALIDATGARVSIGDAGPRDYAVRDGEYILL